ncbi:hypothetical protein WA026_012098 [Henosepilachna vigintioctopunctata]|uniref:Uncharacterized protein n=1 Tax=Henosepilachna vigintioctopunctata TaxID=420089 RepID=A0AAW1VEW5_9CUCU
MRTEENIRVNLPQIWKRIVVINQKNQIPELKIARFTFETLYRDFTEVVDDRCCIERAVIGCC